MRVKVELEVEIDVEATDEQVEEYLKFEFSNSGSCSIDNPCYWAGHDITKFYYDIIYEKD